MIIRKANFGDAEQINKIYRFASELMAENGNPSQWINGYPDIDLIKTDIELSRSYVMEYDGIIHAVFVFIEGEEDPSYKVIDGKWLNGAPYGVIHRIAGDGKVNGVMDECIRFCLGKTKNLRADTHKDNKIMRRLLMKNKFIYCGIIRGYYDGGDRMAYQRCDLPF